MPQKISTPDPWSCDQDKAIKSLGSDQDIDGLVSEPVVSPHTLLKIGKLHPKSFKDIQLSLKSAPWYRLICPHFTEEIFKIISPGTEKS